MASTPARIGKRGNMAPQESRCQSRCRRRRITSKPLGVGMGCCSLVVLGLLCADMTGPAGAQAEDDVSASYDYDGTLLLDSRNFKGMTQQGVWIVMFFSYSVVIKSHDEAYHCQRFTWLWGDLANRYSKLGGETRGGMSPCPPRHILTTFFLRLRLDG